jgi:hypothetical protein
MHKLEERSSSKERREGREEKDEAKKGRHKKTSQRTHKPQLLLQHPVDNLAVLTRLRLVDLVVGAHNGAYAGADGFGEGPEVELECEVVG